MTDHLGRSGDSPLERYRERKVALDAATGQPQGIDYLRDVIRAAEALIDGAKLVIFPAGGQNEAYDLAIRELRYRLEAK